MCIQPIKLPQRFSIILIYIRKRLKVTLLLFVSRTCESKYRCINLYRREMNDVSKLICYLSKYLYIARVPSKQRLLLGTTNPLAISSNDNHETRQSNIILMEIPLDTRLRINRFD